MRFFRALIGAFNRCGLELTSPHSDISFFVPHRAIR
ncbi:MAG: hypothetical protein JWP89_6104 [Schlesneria sp.]|nr:hypothetical protein [Schlesneria sp.]